MSSPAPSAIRPLTSARIVLAGALLGLLLPLPARAMRQGDLADEVAAERVVAERARRLARVEEAVSDLEELLELAPEDPEGHRFLARALFDQGEHGRARAEAERALELARATDRSPELAAAARDLAHQLCAQGEIAAAQSILDGARAALEPGRDARDAWSLGRTAWEAGDRERARELFSAGTRAGDAGGWEGLLARARCERALGRLELASRTLVEADAAAKAGEGVEPEVLAELGSLYFESEREVEAKGKRSAAELYREALRLAPGHEQALLGLYALHRLNYNRASRPAEQILDELLQARPRSIEGRLTEAASAIDDGQLVVARASLAFLREVAPARREVRTLEAALAWVEHRREECEAILAELARGSSQDSTPEREVGGHLNELYRFAEARPFLERAVERDPTDYEAWRELGESLANTGDERRGLEALRKSKTAAAGRQDAWRENTILVLERMQSEHELADYGELSFSWRPDEAEVFATYLEPFYAKERAELAERYGYTPGPTRIEIFRRFADFSVRSVGFQGFPALGVCFGPVVTAVSPLSEVRGSFSWARTGFHEFTHVIHLGLSHNRCPRWITEGLATWEEERKNPAWTRNMRRDLLDARANDDLIPLRELNRAFRGPRILFAYYQGGLLCGMLVRDYGFPPMVRLLEAFDRGLDLDEAFAEVFASTPEGIDERFRAYVDEELAGLALEPRWSPAKLAALRFALPQKPPADQAARADWAEKLCTVAWGSHQEGRRIDAEEALRRVAAAGSKPMRALFLRGEMALSAEDREGAYGYWKEAYDAGGKDYRSLIGLGALCLERHEAELGEAAFLAAEQAFPGFPEETLAAELRLYQLYQARGEEDRALAALERWLDWNSGDYGHRIEVADWHARAGRHAQAERRLSEANEIDPFRRALHRRWGEALLALGRQEEAAREFHVAHVLPCELEGDVPAAAKALMREIASDPELRSLLERGHPLRWSESDRARLSEGQRSAWEELFRGDARERLELARRELECRERAGPEAERERCRGEVGELELLAGEERAH